MSDAELMDQIQALRAELEVLRRDQEVLRASMERSPVRNGTSLRDALRCERCGGTTILHAPQVLDRGHGNAEHSLAIHRPSIWRSRTEGEFEAYICRGCGYAEWYVKDVSSIEADGNAIRELDGSRGPGTGYR